MMRTGLVGWRRMDRGKILLFDDERQHKHQQKQKRTVEKTFSVKERKT